MPPSTSSAATGSASRAPAHPTRKAATRCWRAGEYGRSPHLRCSAPQSELKRSTTGARRSPRGEGDVGRGFGGRWPRGPRRGFCAVVVLRSERGRGLQTRRSRRQRAREKAEGRLEVRIDRSFA